jgi:hypothetical protein
VTRLLAQLSLDWAISGGSTTGVPERSGLSAAGTAPNRRVGETRGKCRSAHSRSDYLPDYCVGVLHLVPGCGCSFVVQSSS